MAVWDELKGVLARLRDQQPETLQEYPDPSHDEGRQPPFAIGLAPWAASTAADLLARFGDDVDLTVGALLFPPGRPSRRRPAAPPQADPLDPSQATAELDGPAVVRSGHTLRRSEEHTSELQSHVNLVCRLLLEKKKTKKTISLSENKNKITHHK